MTTNKEALEVKLADDLDSRAEWLAKRSRVADAILMQRAAKFIHAALQPREKVEGLDEALANWEGLEGPDFSAVNINKGVLRKFIKAARNWRDIQDG